MKHRVTKLRAAAGKVLDGTMLYRSNKSQQEGIMTTGHAEILRSHYQ
jgi:hypothetical protein